MQQKCLFGRKSSPGIKSLMQSSHSRYCRKKCKMQQATSARSSRLRLTQIPTISSTVPGFGAASLLCSPAYPWHDRAEVCHSWSLDCWNGLIDTLPKLDRNAARFISPSCEADSACPAPATSANSALGSPAGMLSSRIAVLPLAVCQCTGLAITAPMTLLAASTRKLKFRPASSASLSCSSVRGAACEHTDKS